VGKSGVTLVAKKQQFLYYIPHPSRKIFFYFLDLLEEFWRQKSPERLVCALGAIWHRSEWCQPT
jgi:hypothetical protein